MKIQHAYCCPQHKSAVVSVLDEMTRRGHEVVEVRLEHDDVTKRKKGFEDVDITNSDLFLCSYPRIMKMNEGGGWKHGAKKTVCIEHGLNPVAWAFPLDRHKLFDVICCPNKWQMKHAGEVKGRCKLTGWGKLDKLPEMRKDRELAKKRLSEQCNEVIDFDKPIIAWIPTHGGAWKRTDEMMNLGIQNLVIAPHESRYNQFREDMQINYEKDYPYYVETTNIYDVISAADVVITDYSSAGIEALVCEDLPIIQILTDVKLHNRDQFRPLEKGYYSLSQKDDRVFKLGANVANMGKLVGEIEKAIADPTGYWKEERDYWRKELLHDVGNATKNCCDFIEKVLQSKA